MEQIQLSTWSNSHKLAPLFSEEQASKIADSFRTASISANTRVAYRKGWRLFAGWCREHNQDPNDIKRVAYEHFIIHISKTFSFSQLEVCHAAVRWCYKNIEGFPEFNFDHPRIQTLYIGISREKKKSETPKQAAVFSLSQLRGLTEICDVQENKGVRNKAIMLLLYWCGMRSDEMVKVKVEHIELFADGWVLRIPEQKNHKETMYKSIPTRADTSICPAYAVHEYIKLFNLKEGDYLCAANLDRGNNIKPQEGNMSLWNLRKTINQYFVGYFGKDVSKFYSCHSFRRSFITHLLDQGVDPADISTQTHQSIQTIITRYDANRHKIKRNYVHLNFNDKHQEVG